MKGAASELPIDLVSNCSFEPAAFARLSVFEDQHFWFRARRQVISDLITQITADLASGYRVLEIGCGTGNVLRTIEQACLDGRVLGLDLFSEGLKYARRRTSCSLIQGDLHALPLAGRFELVGLFDVLEHLPDDERALLDLHRILAAGGTLLLTVPAHPFLWSHVDEISHHRRRYTLTELESKLVGTGYRVVYLTHYMTSILPLIWLSRKLLVPIKRCLANRVRCTRNPAYLELRTTPLLNELFAWILAWETRVIARRRCLSIGSSLLAVARKDSVPVR